MYPIGPTAVGIGYLMVLHGRRRNGEIGALCHYRAARAVVDPVLVLAAGTVGS
jgi:hypothetical protein